MTRLDISDLNEILLKNRVSDIKTLLCWVTGEAPSHKNKRLQSPVPFKGLRIDCWHPYLFRQLSSNRFSGSFEILRLGKKSLFGRLGAPVTKQRPWVRIPLKPEWIIFNIWLIGACSSTIGFSVLTVLFIRPYPLSAGKRYFHELNLELKKIMQQLKEIEKETNISLTLRTWSWFSVVISVAMRFFKNATRSASNKKRASWKHTSNI